MDGLGSAKTVVAADGFDAHARALASRVTYRHNIHSPIHPPNSRHCLDRYRQRM